MDVFVGLLTTAFLASDFFEKVELKAVREKLAKDTKDVLPVLKLVDDGINLAGLEEAGFQILMPEARP